MTHILITVQSFAAIGRRSSEILWLIKKTSRPVVELRGGPRGPGPLERPGAPLETPGFKGYKGASKRPLKAP